MCVYVFVWVHNAIMPELYRWCIRNSCVFILFLFFCFFTLSSNHDGALCVWCTCMPRAWSRWQSNPRFDDLSVEHAIMFMTLPNQTGRFIGVHSRVLSAPAWVAPRVAQIQQGVCQGSTLTADTLDGFFFSTVVCWTIIRKFKIYKEN